ncbi:MAG: hypothetical protein IJR07_00365 [Bacteroidaceae bacterium]|nr:hypothetical protein [Bacteroidaceae bacterium]
MGSAKVCYYSGESLPPQAAISAMGRRSICHTPIGDTATGVSKASDNP